MRKSNWKRRGLNKPITEQDYRDKRMQAGIRLLKSKLPTDLRASMRDQLTPSQEIKLLQSYL